MAEKFDVAARLAEGGPAVDDVQNYVWACRSLGYQNPDLTLNAEQVRDWYGSEDGLDLRAMDADCAALEAVVVAIEDARAQQEQQLAAVSAAWQGSGAEASREFLRRHGEAATAVAASIRTAADAMAALRDDLWHAVDGKVAAALAIADRSAARRADWLAAAQTVTTGSGDRAAASELVDQEIKPFIDNDIRQDWLTAMRTAAAAVTDAYEGAGATLGVEPAPTFAVPGDLGPGWLPPPDEAVATTPASFVASPPPSPVGSAPPAWGGASSGPPWGFAATPPPPPPGPLPAPAALPDAPPAAPITSSGMPPMGGLPDLGSGLSGIGQQLADAFGGLLGTSGDELADPPELDEPDELDDEENAEPKDEETEADSDEEPLAPEVDRCETGDPLEDAPPLSEPPDEPPPPVEPLVPAPEPAPTSPSPPPPPEPEPEPVAGETPCEIAADELPQVGE
ncbi:hypothetical protein A5724_00410 [Mycobacterium sp. ACS1612]|uniref:hypothetical protein n=1 Tax=Mycobacterium sp. ACS1612 TaxID=1834117 RepID=UPI0008021239|nr:hypothetical protein [Mycobacterium sp. ACS1612]OBF42232.1 hypothetical protein A5724_00410 [Mycobacterium sp. ACS1612]